MLIIVLYPGERPLSLESDGAETGGSKFRRPILLHLHHPSAADRRGLHERGGGPRVERREAIPRVLQPSVRARPVPRHLWGCKTAPQVTMKDKRLYYVSYLPGPSCLEAKGWMCFSRSWNRLKISSSAFCRSQTWRSPTSCSPSSPPSRSSTRQLHNWVFQGRRGLWLGYSRGLWSHRHQRSMITGVIIIHV